MIEGTNEPVIGMLMIINDLKRKLEAISHLLLLRSSHAEEKELVG
jgi:hypothetical protein